MGGHLHITLYFHYSGIIKDNFSGLMYRLRDVSVCHFIVRVLNLDYEYNAILGQRLSMFSSWCVCFFISKFLPNTF